MTWLRRLWSRVISWRREIEEPFDYDFPHRDSTPPIESDFGCPDTQPSQPGALDVGTGRSITQSEAP